MPSREVVLTEDEAASLRMLLAALAAIEDVLLRRSDNVVEITRETWRDMVLRPAAGLRGIGPKITLDK